MLETLWIWRKTFICSSKKVQQSFERQKLLKAERKKWLIWYQESTIRLAADFSSEIMLGPKMSLIKFKRTEIIWRIFFWPQWYKTRNQLQEEKKLEKHKHATTKINESVNKSKRKSENTLRQIKMEIQLFKIYGMQKSSSKREFDS